MLSDEDFEPVVTAYYLNNHVNILVLVHEDPSFEGKRIVGLEVEPKSIQVRV